MAGKELLQKSPLSFLPPNNLEMPFRKSAQPQTRSGAFFQDECVITEKPAESFLLIQRPPIPLDKGGRQYAEGSLAFPLSFEPPDAERLFQRLPDIFITGKRGCILFG